MESIGEERRHKHAQAAGPGRPSRRNAAQADGHADDEGGVEPGNHATSERFDAVTRLREQGGISLPSNIALERATNPFLRVAETSVKQMADERAGRDKATPTEVFATLRAWKDSF